MQSQMTEKDNLDLAKSILLEPFGLDEPALIKAMGTIFSHQVDYADLYFQFTKNESWSLEEGIVKTAALPSIRGLASGLSPGTKRLFPILTIYQPRHWKTLPKRPVLSDVRVKGKSNWLP